MDSPDHRRRRKRIFRQPHSSSSLLSVRSLYICLSFLTFIYLLSSDNPFATSPFHPVLLGSNLSSLSSSSLRTVKSVREFRSFFSRLKIENRVLFPDHVLLLVSGGKRARVSECVYRDVFKKENVISVDEYDGLRSIVRCPLPSLNYSNSVDLNGMLVNNKTQESSWKNLAYEAVLDGNTVVVFVKGLNLRPARESDPSPLSCHFRFENSDTYVSTKALAAAQEVIRCPLPRSVNKNLNKAKGIQVTVGSKPLRSRSRRSLFPSVAKISDFRSGRKKHELCVCTMVWNQASAIREWISYHSWLGVEKWFIYDNNSEDEIKEAIQKLRNEYNYNITRQIWPWIKTQEAGFSHCALRAKSECNWVSFIDVDEYYYFPYSTPEHQTYRPLGYASQNSLRDLVLNFSSSSIGEIRTSCHSFGPSGLNSQPEQGVTVGYTCRLLSPERHKSIIRPEALDPTLLNVVHHFRLRKGFEYMNLPESAAVINHYKYQVWKVFRAKFYRRVATYVVDWKENQNEGSKDRAPGLGTEAIEPSDWPQKFCEVWDTGLRDFVLGNLADGSTRLLPWERVSGRHSKDWVMTL